MAFQLRLTPLKCYEYFLSGQWFALIWYILSGEQNPSLPCGQRDRDPRRGPRGPGCRGGWRCQRWPRLTTQGTVRSHQNLNTTDILPSRYYFKRIVGKIIDLPINRMPTSLSYVFICIQVNSERGKYKRHLFDLKPPYRQATKKRSPKVFWLSTLWGRSVLCAFLVLLSMLPISLSLWPIT